MENYVTLGSLKPLGWVCVLLFTGCALFAIHDCQPLPALGSIPFIALGAYLIYSAYSRHSVDTEALTSVSPLGARYRLAWSEVEWVEFGTGGTLVFHGHGKRFVLPAPAFWSGPHKPSIFQLLVSELEKRKLVPVPSNTADYKTNKNVRVSDAA